MNHATGNGNNENTNNSASSTKPLPMKKRRDEQNQKSLGKRAIDRSRAALSPPFPCDGSGGPLGKLSGSNSGGQPPCVDQASDSGGQQQAGQRRSRQQIEREDSGEGGAAGAAPSSGVIKGNKKRQRRSMGEEWRGDGSKIESIQNESSVDPDNSSLNGCVYGNQNSNKSADLAKPQTSG